MQKVSSHKLLVTILVASGALGIAAYAVSSTTPAPATEPLLSSWRTGKADQYAKVREQAGAAPVATWPSENLVNMGGGQSVPTLSDVQQIRFSRDFVYVNSFNLASYVMGPWYIDPQRGRIFGNWPCSYNAQIRFPRNPKPATGRHSPVTLGEVGMLVNGVAIYNYADALSYKNSTGTESPMGPDAGDRIWNRLAWPFEGVTFDPSQLHQPPHGEYHAHGNPVGLRYQLGDNVKYDSATDRYSEDTSKLHHSPIVGWAYDGYPVYGPYGYSDPKNPKSELRRMMSGFVLRNGANHTENLATTGRHTIPAWAAAAHAPWKMTLSDAEYGPDVSNRFQIGRYAEDYDYKGDLGYKQGTDFDLDQYNGRFCITPEYPAGTYAYFCTIDSAGVPQFPNMLGAQYYGVVSGGKVNDVAETVTSYFQNKGAEKIEAWKEYGADAAPAQLAAR